MPKIDREQIGVAFDMQGCPNRCRHCYLGLGSNRGLAESDVRWGVSRFRDFICRTNTPIKKLSVATWFREPDYGDNYRQLYELESELGDGSPNRYELLSVWRLARDRTYADWARSVGPNMCQISLAGMKEATDWFYRRKGAFDDALAATERLLDAGMKPRWQLFLTTKLLPDINKVLRLVEELRLRDRVQEVGGEFQMFMHSPGPEHEGRKIEEFRPTADQVMGLPEAILQASREHFGRHVLWQTEATLCSEIIDDNAPEKRADPLPEALWFLIRSNWDVFANIGTLEPWWCLGNMKEDSVESMIRRFEGDDVLGLQVLFHKSSTELVEHYGDPTCRKIYSDKGDLLSLYRGKHCEREWNKR